MDETYEVIITPEANQNLKFIIDYLMENETWTLAERVKKELLNEIKSLSKMPSANGILHEISDKKLVFRRRLKWHYRIIFLIEEKEKLVFIVAIDSTKQNPSKLLEGLK